MNVSPSAYCIKPRAASVGATLQPGGRAVAVGLVRSRCSAGKLRTPTGTIRLHAPPIAFVIHIESVLAAFQTRCPEVLLDLTTDDAILNIVQHGFDIGVRLDKLPMRTWSP
jgi:DNA-binding transcriptional LysR family regulator